VPRYSRKADCEDRRRRDALRPRGVWRNNTHGLPGLSSAAEVGEYVLVHVGFAISRIDEDEAKATLAYLEELGELQAELGALEASHEALG